MEESTLGTLAQALGSRSSRKGCSFQGLDTLRWYAEPFKSGQDFGCTPQPAGKGATIWLFDGPVT